MSAPEGRTVREQLEAWVHSQPEPKRESALRLAGLENLYRMIQTDGELSKKVQFSLQSPRIQKKLTAVGIDVDSSWVDMAKKTVDPTKDWFPEVTTRKHVVDLLRPYVSRIGGDKQLSRMFFDGAELDSFYGFKPKSLPGFVNIAAMLKFCIEDARSGKERTSWTSETLFFMEGQWNVFGRGKMPLPELTSEARFTDWFARRIPYERVDHVAKSLNEALGEQTLTSALFISWRKGQQPSRQKFESFLRAIKVAFPEWLEAESRGETPAASLPPDEQPAQVTPPVTVSPPAQANTSPISSVLRRIMEGIAAKLPNLEREERALVQRIAAKHADDPGEVVYGMRFVLTAGSFKRVAVFSLNEVEDTASLIGELARRLVQMNSMTTGDKRAVLKRLQPAFDELFVQVRHMDAQQEDLPAMFLDMRMTAAALTGADLDDIKS